MIVADASAVASFLIPDEAGPLADFAHDTFASEEVEVPPHSSLEMASVIWKAIRRKRLDEADAARVAAAADAIAATVLIGPTPPIARLVALAIDEGLTVYDAGYLWLALERGAGLLSHDTNLRRAAERHGVEVLTP